MPPKKAPAPSKKAEQKKKEKVIEDKTFGIKNKKGAKQQKFIQQVEKQVKSGGVNSRKLEDPNIKKLEKEKKLKEQKELALIFKPVQTQKIDKGTDPKSVVCAFFKQGQCTKGDKCKFSHDLSIERKAEKRSLYCDMRDDDKETDTMDKWDEDKLKEVVEKKHGSGNRPTTDIICKHFLEAVEKSKYGWFWECPSGQKCIYRHALPPGFVLKKDKKKEDKKDEISLEDLIETERANLGPNQTKITLETFLAWKKRKLKEKKEQALKDEEKRRNDYKAGRQVGISGREMFYFNPELAAGDGIDDGDEAISSYVREEDETEEKVEYRELDMDRLALEASEIDTSGITVAGADRLKNNKDINNESGSTVTVGEGAAALAINENLFKEEDLEGLEEELEGLDLEE
ncbi:zinc finger CCCH domain-containing protein 15 homolog [Bombus vosnesenskii]|uniref:Zinc finger CCCH domain-containing protein 15 n=3 Tax=Pyrobombus TaxID=144703 RepID=A0A6J3L007_9HYME|nr:zinc finger CCCH domain-containing protein 15 homolog [Bombus impatiens]XP_033194513.1 zinc finger CCCH domain-containing protein 15 homolog [Bombus vancouverensis nearcticus]XP_033305691.1 zinc finger CCCH domain-containing protein 15 homolog [Bombus bifarius]XP_033358557.1 zinc finger CCCH domain-containing protein 15 homolog [Bombus vosnesenskii]XP_050481456.1 zinc finger CCCH domain-containing protein 15 homolog [Bombus huntii]